MPTYEYACKSCGEHMEVVQSFKDDALTTCPACGGQLRKVFGSIGIAFKGSGFYKTDSRSATSGGGAKKSAEPASAATKSETKSESAKSGTESKGSGSGSTPAAAAS